MKNEKFHCAPKGWSHPEMDPREQYLSAIFMLAGAATTLIILVSITI